MPMKTLQREGHHMTVDVATPEHQGHIVALYRRDQKWSRAKLAEALHVDVCTIYRMEKQSVIKDPKRRQLLIGLLGIPAVLLGLGAEGEKAIPPSTRSVNADYMAFFEQELATRWDIFHTGGTTRAARGLELWLKEVEGLAQESQSSAWHERACTVLAMSYQLQGSVLRDMMRYKQAHFAYEHALNIAQESHNPELTASALARHGVTLVQQYQPVEAITYLNGALTLANGSGLPCLRGYILQALSEAHAIAQHSNESKRYIDLAQRALERRGEVQERTYCQLTTTSVTSQKGVNAVLLRDYNYALTLIDRGLEKYDSTLVRGRSRLIAQKADAYFGLGLIDYSTTTAQEALSLARSVNSQKQIARVEHLHSVMMQSRWKHEGCVARLGTLVAQ